MYCLYIHLYTHAHVYTTLTVVIRTNSNRLDSFFCIVQTLEFACTKCNANKFSISGNLAFITEHTPMHPQLFGLSREIGLYTHKRLNCFYISRAIAKIVQYKEIDGFHWVLRYFQTFPNPRHLMVANYLFS